MRLKFLFGFALSLLTLLISAQAHIGADINGEGALDRSGSAVSLSSDGRYLAIGAPQNTPGPGLSFVGHVRVFHEENGVWNQLGSDIDGESGVRYFGESVSLSGDGTRVAIGTWRYLDPDDSAFDARGYVRIFDLISDEWVQVGEAIIGEGPTDFSGTQIALSKDGTTLIIGSPGNDDAGNDAGQIRVFNLVGGTWMQLGQDIDGSNIEDGFGRSVAISDDGSSIAIGAPHSDVGGNLSGEVRVYTYDGTDWLQKGLSLPGTGTETFFGSSVSISGNGDILAVGSTGGDGQVAVYTFTLGNWEQESPVILPISGELRFGQSVALSTNGLVLAIGAPRSFSNAGAVVVYQKVASVWERAGTAVQGNESLDFAGEAVAISGDGSRFAFGADGNDATGNNAGQTRIFSTISILPVEWLSFDVDYVSKRSILTWSVSQEENVDFYEIQHRVGSSDWNTESKVIARGDNGSRTDYHFIHNPASGESNFYRIKQVDFDGSFSFSKIRVANFMFENDLLLFPNPVSDGVINIRIPSSDFPIQITAYNSLGLVVHEGFSQSHSSLDVSGWPVGHYFIAINNQIQTYLSKIIIR